MNTINKTAHAENPYSDNSQLFRYFWCKMLLCIQKTDTDETCDCQLKTLVKKKKNLVDQIPVRFLPEFLNSHLTPRLSKMSNFHFFKPIWKDKSYRLTAILSCPALLSV